ncbi:MAG: glycosyltransferase [Thermoleophilia bacterium]|nr:glycosyltransferase [Gaiellaceae bacterium]MDW8338920.1 glycosyltransferase [Thermoleophilia bacterium]
MRRRRITVVASELLGAGGVGGAGTADSLLAVALGRAGHDVDLLFARAEHVGTLSSEWEAIYASAGVRVRGLEAQERVDPPYLAPTVDVLSTLRADPPEVVVVNDWRGLGLAPLRAREVGVALRDTAFVVFCHGPSTVLVEFSRKVPDTLERFALDVAERAAIGLADAVVSPSAWLLGWMRARRWPVPADARVIPYLTQATALGEDPPQAERGGRVRRLAFFGQMREGKGVRILLSALNALEPELLEGRELLFLGRVTRRWTPESVTAFLSDGVRQRLAGLRFETALERSDALAELRMPGTLALMPSLLDNSPNTVYECLEQGIPFIASTAGGIPELVAEEDRGRVLVEPEVEPLREALRRALASPDGHAPARPAHDPAAALAAWLEVVESVEPAARRAASRRREQVSVVACGAEALRAATELSAATTSTDVEVVGAPTRGEGFRRARGEWLVFLDDGVVPAKTALEALLAAQRASEADVVTCALAVEDGSEPPALRLALGDAGSLGLVENHYGSLALIRRELVDADLVLHGGKPDPDWPLLAGLALSGARFATVPDPLGTTMRPRGTVRDLPGYGLVVLNLFERAGRPLADLPLLAATLGSAYLGYAAAAKERPDGAPSTLGSALAAARRARLGGLVRRSLARAGRRRGP